MEAYPLRLFHVIVQTGKHAQLWTRAGVDHRLHEGIQQVGAHRKGLGGWRWLGGWRGLGGWREVGRNEDKTCRCPAFPQSAFLLSQKILIGGVDAGCGHVDGTDLAFRT